MVSGAASTSILWPAHQARREPDLWWVRNEVAALLCQWLQNIRHAPSAVFAADRLFHCKGCTLRYVRGQMIDHNAAPTIRGVTRTYLKRRDPSIAPSRPIAAVIPESRCAAVEGVVVQCCRQRPRQTSFPVKQTNQTENVWRIDSGIRVVLHHTVRRVVCSRCHRSSPNGLFLDPPYGWKIDAARARLRATSG